jgi:hypothetical protein
MLDRCRQLQIELNLNKCLFCTPFGILLGHIVCKEGLLVYPAKIAVIVNLPAPTSVKELRARPLLALYLINRCGYNHVE